MIYALILTVYMQGQPSASDGEKPVAVSQSSTIGFTTEQACKNAGEVARAGTGQFYGSTSAFITYQCAPLGL